METGHFQGSQHQPSGHFGEHIAGFGELIQKQGYPRSTATRKIRLVIDLDQWLKRRGIKPTDYDEKWAATFLDYRSEHGSCCRGDPTTLRIFLSHLRDAQAVSLRAVHPPGRDACRRRAQGDPLKIHEHQAKALFRDHGMPVPRGILARTVDEAAGTGWLGS